MAHIVRQVVKTLWCDYLSQKAELIEERVYPCDLIPDLTAEFQLRSRWCALGRACNLAGYPCRWAYTNPERDPLELREGPSK